MSDNERKRERERDAFSGNKKYTRSATTTRNPHTVYANHEDARGRGGGLHLLEHVERLLNRLSLLQACT